MVSIFLLNEEKTHTIAQKLESAYLECEAISKNASSSFYRSFRHLPSVKRKAVNALYAFCRRVDDIVDGDWLPNIDLTFLNQQAENRIEELSLSHDTEPANKEPGHTNRVKALLWFRMNLDKIERGEHVDEPIFLALADSVNRFAIDLVHLRDLISGMEDDLYKINYQNFEDLRQYCYRAASTVGLCLVEIYGYDDPNARRHAVEMGKYLQMVNVLRDIQEDLDRGRIYLPLEEMAKFGISKKDLHDEKLPQTEGWQEFMRHYLDHILAHRKNAIGLLSLIDKDSRYSPSLMCAAYDAILEEAMRRNGDVLSRRLKMGLYRKLQFALGMIRKPRINLFSTSR